MSAKKEALLQNKIGLEEKRCQLEQEVTGWLEPCRRFLEEAHQTHQLAASENLASQKEYCQKIGSNFLLAGKTLRFSCHFPWRLLAEAAPGAKMWRRPESNRGPNVLEQLPLQA